MRRINYSTLIFCSLIVGCDPTRPAHPEWTLKGPTMEFITPGDTPQPSCETNPSRPRPSGILIEADENGDGEGTCTGIPIAVQSYGNGHEQYPLDIVMDEEGNSVIIGGIEGNIDFGKGELASAGYRDIFVLKLNDRGEILWSRSFGDAQYQQAQRVTLDAAGNIFVTGYFKGTVDFGDGPLVSEGNRDAFLVKLDRFGGHVWSKRFGDAGEQYGRGVAADADGNIYLSGSTTGTVDFGNGPLTSAGWEDIFVVKFDRDGFPLWSKLFGDATTQDCWDLVTDSKGNLVLTGFIQGVVDFGNGIVEVATGQPDALLIKFDPSGETLWSKTAPGDGLQYGQSVSIDVDDNIIMTGAFNNEINIDGTVLRSAGQSDIFVAKFSPSGLLDWGKRFGDEGEQFSVIGSTDREKNILLTGTFEGTMNFGGGALPSQGFFDVFLAKLDPLGGYLWGRSFGDAEYQEGVGIVADAIGNVHLLGTFGGTMSFGESSITASGPVSLDVFIGTLSP